MPQIDLSNIMNITISDVTSSVIDFNVANLTIFTNETPVVALEDSYAVYKNTTDVLAQWGTNSEVYKIALTIFSQSYNILNAGGVLIVIPLLNLPARKGKFTTIDLTNKIINFKDITDGSITIKIDGVDKDLTVLNFGDTPTLTSIKNVLDTAIDGDCTVEIDGNTLVFTSLTNGASSSIEFIANATGTDISTLDYLYIENGIKIDGQIAGEETLIEAIARTKDLVYYEGILTNFSIDAISQSDLLNLCGYIKTIDKILYYQTSDVAQLNADSKFYLIKQAEYYTTRLLYYSQNYRFDSAYASRLHSVNFENESTITMHLKNLSGIIPDETITQSIINKCENIGVDFYGALQNRGVVFSNGANQYSDYVINILWFKLKLKSELINLLTLNNNKLAQTEEYMNVLKSAIRKVCEMGIKNNFISPGTWTSPDTFGDRATFLNSISQIGYYIYSNPLSEQSASEREARIAPLILLAVKLSGAFHYINLFININK